jgi:hypothetical protein
MPLNLNTGVTKFAGSTNNVSPTFGLDTGSFPRQDACFPKPMSYTKISNAGQPLPDTALPGANPTDWNCTQDNLSELMWEIKTPGNNSILYSLAEAQSYVSSLNAARYCGFTDWRLPSITELFGVMNFGFGLPTVDPSWFPNIKPLNFWSNTARLPLTLMNNFFVSTGNGMVGAAQPNAKHAVMAVRGVSVGLKPAIVTPTTVSIGTLMWKREMQAAPWHTWAAALQASVADRTDGFTDWRLPNIKEAQTLIDYSKDVGTGCLRSEFTKDLAKVWMWSATPAADLIVIGLRNHSLNINTDIGTVMGQDRISGAHVRLVRNTVEQVVVPPPVVPPPVVPPPVVPPPVINPRDYITRAEFDAWRKA